MPNQKMLAERDELHHDFLDLGRCVEGVVAVMARSFDEPHWSGNDRVGIGNGALNELGTRIAERCQRILLLYQPVASDFREVTALLRMVAELEQVAKLAPAITIRPANRIALPRPIFQECSHLVASVHEMIHLALSAYEDRRLTLAHQVKESHLEITDLARMLTESLTSMMKSDSTMIEAGLNLFSLLQHVQRIADHVASLIEQVQFLQGSPSDCFVDNNWRVVGVEQFHAHRLFG